MNAVRQEMRAALRVLAGTPAAMFVAVLTAGFFFASAAQHLGLGSSGHCRSRRSNVVLACPRTNAARSTAAGAHAPGRATMQNSAATLPHSAADPAVANAGVASGKQPAGKAGSGRLTVPLPDFSAPELSRFISPL